VLDSGLLLGVGHGIQGFVGGWGRKGDGEKGIVLDEKRKYLGVSR